MNKEVLLCGCSDYSGGVVVSNSTRYYGGTALRNINFSPASNKTNYLYNFNNTIYRISPDGVYGEDVIEYLYLKEWTVLDPQPYWMSWQANIIQYLGSFNNQLIALRNPWFFGAGLEIYDGAAWTSHDFGYDFTNVFISSIEETPDILLVGGYSSYYLTSTVYCFQNSLQSWSGTAGVVANSSGITSFAKYGSYTYCSAKATGSEVGGVYYVDNSIIGSPVLENATNSQPLVSSRNIYT